MSTQHRSFRPPSAGGAAALAEVGMNHAGRQTRNDSPNGGESKIETLNIGGVDIYQPRNAGASPMPAESWQLLDTDKSTPVVLCDPDAVVPITLHRVFNLAAHPQAKHLDVVLPYHLRRKDGDYKSAIKILCHGHSLQEDEKPEVTWSMDGRKHVCTGKLGQQAKVEQQQNGAWQIQTPVAHPMIAPTDIYPAFANLDEAKADAERLVAEAEHCPACLTRYTTDRATKGDPEMSRSDDLAHIPFFSLRWLALRELKVAEPKGGAPSKYKRPTHGISWDQDTNWTPSARDRAIRGGWGLMDFPTAARSQNVHNSAEYRNYVARINCICANCLTADGRRPAPVKIQLHNGQTRSEPGGKVDIGQVLCPLTDEPLLSDEAVMALTDIERARLCYEFRENPVLTQAYLEGSLTEEYLQKEQGKGMAIRLIPATGSEPARVMVVPSVVYFCNSCENPRPLKVSEVITRVYKEKDAPLKFTLDESDGIVRRDWSKMFFTTDQQQTVLDAARVKSFGNTEEVFNHLGDGIGRLFYAGASLGALKKLVGAEPIGDSGDDRSSAVRRR